MTIAVGNMKGEMAPMKIKRIIVDEIPKTCGKCWLMRFDVKKNARCSCIPDNCSYITGDPHDMNYRRSDCPLVEEISRPRTIDDLDLSTRAYNCLIRHGVRTIGQLKAMPDEELKQVRNIGIRCVDEIKEKLEGLEDE